VKYGLSLYSTENRHRRNHYGHRQQYGHIILLLNGMQYILKEQNVHMVCAAQGTSAGDESAGCPLTSLTVSHRRSPSLTVSHRLSPMKHRTSPSKTCPLTDWQRGVVGLRRRRRFPCGCVTLLTVCVSCGKIGSQQGPIGNLKSSKLRNQNQKGIVNRIYQVCFLSHRRHSFSIIFLYIECLVCLKFLWTKRSNTSSLL
jgi:hypothetical protein